MPSIELNMDATNIAEKLAEIVKTYPGLFKTRDRFPSPPGDKEFKRRMARLPSALGVVRGDELEIRGERYKVCRYDFLAAHFVCTNGVSTKIIPKLDVYRGTAAHYRLGIRVDHGPVYPKFIAREISDEAIMSRAASRVRTFRPAYAGSTPTGRLMSTTRGDFESLPRQ